MTFIKKNLNWIRNRKEDVGQVITVKMVLPSSLVWEFTRGEMVNLLENLFWYGFKFEKDQVVVLSLVMIKK